MNKRKEGFFYEEMAANILQQTGFAILKRNIYTCVGELDILAEKDKVLYFFEVRYKKDSSHGTPKESLTAIKYRKMKHTMLYLIKRDHIKLPAKLAFIGIQSHKSSFLPYREERYIGMVLPYRGSLYDIEILLSLSPN